MSHHRSSFASQIIDQDLLHLLNKKVSQSSAGSFIRNRLNSSCGRDIFSSTHDLHPFFQRSVVRTHRGFDIALGTEKLFLYTGRGPSTESMHLGHLVPFLLTKFLHDVIFPHAPLVIQLSDDEKYIQSKSSLANIKYCTRNNLRDILAMGFDKNRTFVFTNSGYIHKMYPTVLRVQKALTINTLNKTFGLDGSDCIGKYLFPSMQIAACFAECFEGLFQTKGDQNSQWRALVPCAFDQDPFFILARLIARKLNHLKPSILHCDYVPSLKNLSLKMSSSKPENGVIFLSDSRDTIYRKIKGAYSGGYRTLEEFRKHGGKLGEDVSYQLLKYFLNDNNEYLEIGKNYSRGKISSGAIKDYTAELISHLILEWQERRQSVTQDDIDFVQKERSIENISK